MTISFNVRCDGTDAKPHKGEKSSLETGDSTDGNALNTASVWQYAARW
jgi:hypothetical protein